ncbi:hypothetical protein [Alicyclobacillus shizuokensis]|uniref:hypothetical protein n=1 Tax=Alicyclobacillus shizuokensis TaxID=392014 RepID=UPI000833F66D|nr:hypothetical protein [Alicyclobacillus shizuokensis]
MMERLVGVKEAGDLLGWSRQKASVYWQRRKFPDPIQILSATPVWTEQQIIDYAEEELGMSIWRAEKRIDLGEYGEFDVEFIRCEPDEGWVARAEYVGVWHRPEGEPVRAVIDAQFMDPVEDDVDAVLNAGWDLWTVEEE